MLKCSTCDDKTTTLNMTSTIFVFDFFLLPILLLLFFASTLMCTTVVLMVLMLSMCSINMQNKSGIRVSITHWCLYDKQWIMYDLCNDWVSQATPWPLEHWTKYTRNEQNDIDENNKKITHTHSWSGLEKFTQHTNPLDVFGSLIFGILQSLWHSCKVLSMHKITSLAPCCCPTLKLSWHIQPHRARVFSCRLRYSMSRTQAAQALCLVGQHESICCCYCCYSVHLQHSFCSRHKRMALNREQFFGD